MIFSVAPTALIYKYNISSGGYTPACDIPLLRSLFLPDSNNLFCNLADCFSEVEEGLAGEAMRVEGDWGSGIATFANALYEWDLCKETDASLFR